MMSNRQATVNILPRYWHNQKQDLLTVGLEAAWGE